MSNLYQAATGHMQSTMTDPLAYLRTAMNSAVAPSNNGPVIGRPAIQRPNNGIHAFGGNPNVPNPARQTQTTLPPKKTFLDTSATDVIDKIAGPGSAEKMRALNLMNLISGGNPDYNNLDDVDDSGNGWSIGYGNGSNDIDLGYSNNGQNEIVVNDADSSDDYNLSEAAAVIDEVPPFNDDGYSDGASDNYLPPEYISPDDYIPGPLSEIDGEFDGAFQNEVVDTKGIFNDGQLAVGGRPRKSIDEKNYGLIVKNFVKAIAEALNLDYYEAYLIRDLMIFEINQKLDKSLDDAAQKKQRIEQLEKIIKDKTKLKGYQGKVDAAKARKKEDIIQSFSLWFAKEHPLFTEKDVKEDKDKKKKTKSKKKEDTDSDEEPEKEKKKKKTKKDTTRSKSTRADSSKSDSDDDDDRVKSKRSKKSKKDKKKSKKEKREPTGLGGYISVSTDDSD